MATILPDDPERDWHTAGVFEVLPGVYRVPLPMPNDGLTAVNVYVLADPESVTLVDGGWNVDEAWTALHGALRALDVGPRQVDRVLVTHAHRDHYTLAVRLRREFGTHVALGAEEKTSVLTEMDPAKRPFGERLAILRRAGARELVEEILASPRESAHRTWAEPDEWLTPATRRFGARELEIVPTPGHTRGHLTFVDASANAMFTGDHVLPRITPSLGLEGAPDEDPLSDYLVSLQRVLDLPDRLLLPAHGPAGPSVHARATELLAHHARRLDECERAVRAGADTGDAVARVLVWTRRGRAFTELDLFNRVFAVSETVAHLLVLAGQGRVRAELDRDGVRRYAVS